MNDSPAVEGLDFSSIMPLCSIIPKGHVFASATGFPNSCPNYVLEAKGMYDKTLIPGSD